jgi:hypothetical protein
MSFNPIFTSSALNALNSPDALNRVNGSRNNTEQQAFDDAVRQFESRLSGIHASNLAMNLAIDGLLESKSAAHDPSTSSVKRQLEHIVEMGFYARPTRFSFFVDGFPANVNERLVRNCMATSMPGRSLMSQGFKIYGPPVEQVYEAMYGNEIGMTFRVGQDMMERDLFERWMNMSISYRTSDVSYPDDYMTTMRIYQLNRMDGYVYAVRLSNVFCKSISDMEFSSDASDQLHTVNVSLGYTDYAVIGRLNPREQKQTAAADSPVSGRRAIYTDSASRIVSDRISGEQQAMNNLNNIVFGRTSG